MDNALLDAYFKKSVDLTLRHGRLTFAVSQTLFSSHQIDIGTVHLLKTLESHLPDNPRKILDLGCGYGPIGLTLGRWLPDSCVHLVDRDALALEFTRHNAAQGHVNNVLIYGSLGYDSIEDNDFDLVVSNIPGKAGEEVIRLLLTDAHHYLTPGGIVAVVVVSPLEPLVLETLTHPDIEILRHETRSAHVVFHYRFTSPHDGEPPPGAVDRGLYDRESLAFALDDVSMTMQTAYGLPEFDTLSFQTTLLLKSLQELDVEHVDQATVFQPGQGYIPVALWQLVEPRVLHLTDRDLLSLHYAKLNLLDNGCGEDRIRTHHQVLLTPDNGEMDLIVGILREEEGQHAIEHTLADAGSSLVPGGLLLIAGESTPITRILKSQELGRNLRLLKRQRHKGNSVALLQRRAVQSH